MTYTDLNMLLAGLGMLVLGGVIGFLISAQARRRAVANVERDAEQRIANVLAEDERNQRLELLEEKDEWYKVKAQQERELEEQSSHLTEREKELADVRQIGRAHV